MGSMKRSHRAAYGRNGPFPDLIEEPGFGFSKLGRQKNISCRELTLPWPGITLPVPGTAEVDVSNGFNVEIETTG